ncbi:MAG: conjugative transposon protein TraM [Pseudosphingobacterium sp.]|nr:conjugative transposon protein TraM [Pseudosphingobacterium sp.]
MKINFKQPRYVLPLIILPFLCVFFYIYRGTVGEEKVTEADTPSLQESIGDVSDNVRKKSLSDKLDAFRNQYRNADGYTAIGEIADERENDLRVENPYNSRERQMLDSLQQALQKQAAFSAVPSQAYAEEERQDAALRQALQAARQPQVPPSPRQRQDEDPMELFKKQMALVDSIGKASDPEYQKEEQKRRQMEEFRKAEEEKPRLSVKKASAGNESQFNTVIPAKEEVPIQAIIDENITGYASSRLRIRLLEDISAGTYHVPKGTFLFANITGFTGQRVLLTVTSIQSRGNILPVRLEIYDNDGMQGLYVPQSAFREFSTELGSSGVQGLTLQQQAAGNTQLVMSTLQRMFQSTTAAVSKLIRKNKAQIKYNSQVYLIDPSQLKNQQQSYQ